MKIQTVGDYRKAVTAIKRFRKQWGRTKSVCPFCSGSKVKPFVRHGKCQDCSNCDKNGEVTNDQMVKWGLYLPLDEQI